MAGYTADEPMIEVEAVTLGASLVHLGDYRTSQRGDEHTRHPARSALFPEEHSLEEAKAEVRRLASGGRPALGAEVRVVDERDCDVKPEEVGEIVVRGPHIMVGY
jgi:acyl-CoA synthetase (AMP-forming)/AMP-acid ligase II